MVQKRMFKKSSNPNAGMTKKAVDEKQTKDIKKIKKVLKAIQPEKKVLNYSPSSFTSWGGSSPIFSLMNGMVQGSAEGQREGNSVHFVHMELNYNYYSTTALLQPYSIRVMVIVDNSAEGVALNATDVFQTASPSTFQVRNFQTREFQKRFKILYDKIHVVSPPSSSSTVTSGTGTYFVANMSTPNTSTVKVSKKISVSSDYSRGDAGTIADIDTKSMYFVAINDNGTSSQIDMNYDLNLFYFDV